MSQNTKTILEFKKKKGSRMNIQSKRPYLDTESGWLNSSTAMLLSSKLGISTAFNEDVLPGGLVTSLLISTEKFMSSLEILVSSCFSWDSGSWPSPAAFQNKLAPEGQMFQQTLKQIFHYKNNSDKPLRVAILY